MRAGFKNTYSPRGEELERKRREFYALERRLAKLEHDREDIREEISDFEAIYTARMVDRIAELDNLKQELAKSRAEKTREQDTANRAEQQQESAGDDDAETIGASARIKVQPVSMDRAESIRDIYRKVAKTIHPDLSRNEEERKRRQQLMAEANRAYAEEDRVTLLAIMEEWELGPDFAFISPNGELNLITRRIARITESIRALEAEIARLKNTDLYRLILRVQEAKRQGRDVLAEMAAKLDADILAACRKLNETARTRQTRETAPDESFRVVRFAENPVGTLYIREKRSSNFLDWRKLGDAVGDVAVPAGKSLRLDVREGAAAELDNLDHLNPSDLQACFLYGATDAELSHILRFKGIEDLYLSGTGITSEGMIHLMELNGVERLYLYDTAVTDPGLFCLKYLTRLKYLTLCNAPVTEAAVNRLKLFLPACRIVNLHGGRK